MESSVFSTIIYFSIQTNFEKRGKEFEVWVPSDWTESPKYLNNIKDDNFREFAIELNNLWRILGRKMKDDVAVSQQHHNLIAAFLLTFILM